MAHHVELQRLSKTLGHAKRYAPLKHRSSPEDVIINTVNLLCPQSSLQVPPGGHKFVEIHIIARVMNIIRKAEYMKINGFDYTNL